MRGIRCSRRPRLAAELRLEPGAKGEARKAERRTGQLRRRAQHLHARVVSHGPSRPSGLRSKMRTFVMPQPLQGQGRRKPGHAGADDGDVEHRSMVGMQTRIEPGLRRRDEQQIELPAETCFELGKGRGAWSGARLAGSIEQRRGPVMRDAPLAGPAMAGAGSAAR